MKKHTKVDIGHWYGVITIKLNSENRFLKHSDH